ncbi:hypothetical protein HK096_008517 [Nowakowskiella sp. JEL0078]|nr:hypothetical protein HK096_008517 [Nowakowskiella sp. JEL0078]
MSSLTLLTLPPEILSKIILHLDTPQNLLHSNRALMDASHSPHLRAHWIWTHRSTVSYLSTNSFLETLSQPVFPFSLMTSAVCGQLVALLDPNDPFRRLLWGLCVDRSYSVPLELLLKSVTVAERHSTLVADLLCVAVRRESRQVVELLLDGMREHDQGVCGWRCKVHCGIQDRHWWAAVGGSALLVLSEKLEWGDECGIFAAVRALGEDKFDEILSKRFGFGSNLLVNANIVDIQLQRKNNLSCSQNFR